MRMQRIRRIRGRTRRTLTPPAPRGRARPRGGNSKLQSSTVIPENRTWRGPNGASALTCSADTHWARPDVRDSPIANTPPENPHLRSIGMLHQSLPERRGGGGLGSRDPRPRREPSSRRGPPGWLSRPARPPLPSGSPRLVRSRESRLEPRDSSWRPLPVSPVRRGRPAPMGSSAGSACLRVPAHEPSARAWRSARSKPRGSRCRQLPASSST